MSEAKDVPRGHRRSDFGDRTGDIESGVVVSHTHVVSPSRDSEQSIAWFCVIDVNIYETARQCRVG